MTMTLVLTHFGERFLWKQHGQVNFDGEIRLPILEASAVYQQVGNDKYR